MAKKRWNRLLCEAMCLPLPPWMKEMEEEKLYLMHFVAAFDHAWAGGEEGEGGSRGRLS